MIIYAQRVAKLEKYIFCGTLIIGTVLKQILEYFLKLRSVINISVTEVTVTAHDLADHKERDE